MAIASCPAPAAEEPSGLHVFEDFLWLERLDEQLHVTPLATHGTTPLRLATGYASSAPLDSTPCPRCDRTLMRVPGDLTPAGATRIAAGLDGIEDLLAWRVTAEHTLELAPAPGADHGTLDAQVLECVKRLGDQELERTYNSERDFLKWLGSTSEREEQHVAGAPHP